MLPLIVIPARMAATRLPGKPLADIAGKPMIVRMVEIALATGLGPVVVAAGDAEIVRAVEAAGGRAVLTDPDLPSGTDRVFAALRAQDEAFGGDHDVIVNLQGDMPTITPSLVVEAVAALKDGADIATLVSPSDAAEDRDNPNVVKAIVAADGRALYFTRAAAPHGDGPVWRHVGIYVYTRDALERFVAAAPSPLELREKLEQLRALEMGMTIRAGVVADFPKGVDSPADLELARRVFAGLR
ncbi:MAG: 3-deoxy-manno-octulosonate cytidylyltransferase [Alphaproteobacteria bacterium]|nr:3-deoxy-manno-octulosonate cytidylyltransferase [Alphaproteobacteria bacterium]